MTGFRLTMVCLYLGFLAACSDAPVGTKSRPFSIYFIPSVESQSLLTGGENLSKYLSKAVSQKLYSKDTGFYVKSAVPSSYVAVVEAFGNKKADFAVFTTFAYILARDIKKYDVEAVFSILRAGDDGTYKGQFIARADSPIKSIDDLKGKRFAFVDPASTAGYILAKRKLDEKGIQLGETVFAQKHDNVVTMVYQKQVDAGATYYSAPLKKTVNGKTVEEIQDARARVKKQFPDVEEKVKVIGYTDEIPNEPWVIRKTLFADAELNDKVKKAVVDSFMEYMLTDEGMKLLETVASATGLRRVDDSVYDEIRKIVLDSDLDLEGSMKKKG